MFAVVAAILFAIAVLMHAFGWSSGKVDVALFALLGLLCAALHLAGFGSYVGRRFGRRTDAGQ